MESWVEDLDVLVEAGVNAFLEIWLEGNCHCLPWWAEAACGIDGGGGWRCWLSFESSQGPSRQPRHAGPAHGAGDGGDAPTAGAGPRRQLVLLRRRHAVHADDGLCHDCERDPHRRYDRRGRRGRHGDVGDDQQLFRPHLHWGAILARGSQGHGGDSGHDHGHGRYHRHRRAHRDLRPRQWLRAGLSRLPLVSRASAHRREPVPHGHSGPPDADEGQREGHEDALLGDLRHHLHQPVGRHVHDAPHRRLGEVERQHESIGHIIRALRQIRQPRVLRLHCPDRPLAPPGGHAVRLGQPHRAPHHLEVLVHGHVLLFPDHPHLLRLHEGVGRARRAGRDGHGEVYG
mmetsp:Transcript_11050/g.29474  ORF Transcript_11050/g.29474 Transcript_11050/m.29474 type:complete len:344 (-) Transcript_11050:1272-2303(-)